MEKRKYINNLSLEYLINPCLLEKINNKNKITEIDQFDEIKFYKKRIIQITKDMCKGEYDNLNIKNIFLNYCSNIIYYFKQLDSKDIIQSNYNDLELNKIREFDKSNDNSLNNLINIMISNYKLEKKNKVQLDSFIKKINIENKNTFIPQKIEMNIKDPNLKMKGVKKKSNNNIK